MSIRSCQCKHCVKDFWADSLELSRQLDEYLEAVLNDSKKTQEKRRRDNKTTKRNKRAKKPKSKPTKKTKKSR